MAVFEHNIQTIPSNTQVSRVKQVQELMIWGLPLFQESSKSKNEYAHLCYTTVILSIAQMKHNQQKVIYINMAEAYVLILLI